MKPIQLVTLAPGHFHAALLQKTMLPAVDPRVRVYAPFDADLISHLQRIQSFNQRDHNPTHWSLDVFAGADWRERFLRESPGDIVVLSGRNRGKIDLMEMAVAAGKHVLADKPWIIEAVDCPRVPRLLERAARAGLRVHDVMTERFEITSLLQRDLVNDKELFGSIEPGDAERPGVVMRSVHFLKKTVAGSPLRRPGWFFDIGEEGEALADVGTHLVDLTLWTLHSRDPLTDPRDVRIVRASRWPTRISLADFRAITGLDRFPSETASDVRDGLLHCFCNTRVTYALRNVHVRLDVLWDLEAAPGGGDTHDAVYRGTNADVAIRQTSGHDAELFVTPRGGSHEQIRDRLRSHVAAWQTACPGIALAEVSGEFAIEIPPRFRIGHEAHFAEVAAEFFEQIRDSSKRPTWEDSHLAVKYFLTTHGVARSRNTP